MSFNVEVRNQDGSKTKLSLTIAGIIATLRENKKYANIKKRTECKELSEGINDILKSNFTVVIDPRVSQNASVEVPLIDANNPMWRQVYRDWFGEALEETAEKDAYRSSDGMLVGEISEDGTLGGYFSKIKSTITVSYDMIYPGTRWKVTEHGSTGIILHEIGHFVNFLRAMGWMCRTNYVLAQAHSRLMGVGDSAQRKQILKDICLAESMDIDDSLDTLAKLNDEKTTTTVLVGGMLTNMRNELGANVYDARGFESLSDNFAAQHGNGLDLVIALDTMPGMRFSKKNTVEGLITDVLKTSLMVSGMVLNPAQSAFMILIALFFYDPEGKIYDDPRERYKRVADNLISTLRANRKGDNSKLIADVEQIHSIMSQYKGNRGIFESIYETLSPSGRQSKSLRELNQHLEEFSNNKLYLSAAKFNQHGQKS